MVKSVKNMNPSEAMIDHIICERQTVFKRDQRKAAMLAAETIDDRDDLCLILQMLGLDVRDKNTIS